MKEDENIDAYLQRVDEIKNALECLGEPVDLNIVVRKILRTMLERFNPKVYVLEYSSNLAHISKYEFHGVLMAYEMRIEEEDDTSHLETTFAASKKTSKDKHTLKVKNCSYKEEENEEDEEEFSDK